MSTTGRAVVRDATAGDLAAIKAIYDHYVAHTTATFDLDPSPEAKWRDLLSAAAAPDSPLLVVADDTEAGQVRGFAYASAYRPKPAYRHTRETTIYLAPDAGGRGLGRRLYDDLLARLRAHDIHLAIAVIAVPNDASEHLHAACGFTRAGTVPQVGRKFDAWVDTETWTRLLT